MLVQPLNDYAHTYLARELAEPAFEERPVRYLLEIHATGRFLGITLNERTVRNMSKGKEVVHTIADTMLAPVSPVNRNSGVYPLLGCDALSYVLGPRLGAWSKEADLEKHRKHFEGDKDSLGFKALLRQAAQETGDPALAACLRFYEDEDALEKARSNMEKMKPGAGELACLSVRPEHIDPDNPGGPVTHRASVMDWWREYYLRLFKERHAKGREGYCLLTGEKGTLAVTHETIKGATSLGGQASGVSLMSFDKSSFCSYGWDKNANSPMLPLAARGYVLALNDLLRKGLHHQGRSHEAMLHTRRDVGALALLFWTKEPQDQDLMALIEAPDPVNVKQLLDAPWKDGGALPEQELNNIFYLLGVTANGGRLVVQSWHFENLKTVRRNVANWFQELEVPNCFTPLEPTPPPGIYTLVNAILPRARVSGAHDQNKPDKKREKQQLQLCKRALFGQPLGRHVLAAALARVRREQRSNRVYAPRVGLIRLCVNDIATYQQQGAPLMTKDLDWNQTDTGYICGRLLAVYENLQYEALGRVNVTVGDRYFSTASTYPLLAFKRLEDLSHAHLKRLRRDKRSAQVAITNRISELIELLGAKGGNYPKRLSLEEQGRFIIGYHHQKADDLRQAHIAKEKKEAKTAALNENGKATETDIVTSQDT